MKGGVVGLLDDQVSKASANGKKIAATCKPVSPANVLEGRSAAEFEGTDRGLETVQSLGAAGRRVAGVWGPGSYLLRFCGVLCVRANRGVFF